MRTDAILKSLHVVYITSRGLRGGCKLATCMLREVSPRDFQNMACLMPYAADYYG